MTKKSLKTAIFISILTLPFFSGAIIHAEDFPGLSSLSLDTTHSVKVDKGYGLPTKILVTPVSIGTKINSAKWMKGIYYYTVDKLGFQDIPYHYLISDTGEVYKANSSGDEKEINIEGLGESNIIVGYLNSGSDDFVSPASETKLGNLLLDIANRNAIKPENIFVAGTKFVKERETNTITIEKYDLLGKWSESVGKVVNTIKAKYSPTAKSYSVDIQSVTTPTDEVMPGSEVAVSIKLKNTGGFGLYQGSDSELVLTRENGSASNFFVNNVWLSQSQTSLMAQDESLLTDKDKTFEFKVKAPLSVGSYSEIFTLKTLNGASIKLNSLIDLKLNLKKTDKQIIEIKAGASGFVNVRKDPNQDTVLRKVTSGERFFLLDLNQETLWARIDLGDGVEGYIAAWQFSYL